VRIVEGLTGNLDLDLELAPRPEYGIPFPTWFLTVKVGEPLEVPKLA
jgi:hypothetical protein